jgi:hypothetical protein
MTNIAEPYIESGMRAYWNVKKKTDEPLSKEEQDEDRRAVTAVLAAVLQSFLEEDKIKMLESMAYDFDQLSEEIQMSPQQVADQIRNRIVVSL